MIHGILRKSPISGVLICICILTFCLCTVPLQCRNIRFQNDETIYSLLMTTITINLKLFNMKILQSNIRLHYWIFQTKLQCTTISPSKCALTVFSNKYTTILTHTTEWLQHDGTYNFSSGTHNWTTQLQNCLPAGSTIAMKWWKTMSSLTNITVKWKYEAAACHACIMRSYILHFP